MARSNEGGVTPPRLAAMSKITGRWLEKGGYAVTLAGVRGQGGTKDGIEGSIRDLGCDGGGRRDEECRVGEEGVFGSLGRSDSERRCRQITRSVPLLPSVCSVRPRKICEVAGAQGETESSICGVYAVVEAREVEKSDGGAWYRLL